MRNTLAIATKAIKFNNGVFIPQLYLFREFKIVRKKINFKDNMLNMLLESTFAFSKIRKRNKVGLLGQKTIKSKI